MNTYTSITCGLVLAATLSGCASIIHGTQQKEIFVSQPTAAKIEIDNIPYGETPVTIKLARSEQHLVRISLPGYQPAEFRLTQSISGWAFGNLIFGGLIGIVVDLADGAIYNLKPTGVVSQVAEAKKHTITITLVRNGLKGKNLQKIGQLKAA